MIEFGSQFTFEAKKNNGNGPRPEDGKSGKGKETIKGTGAKQPVVIKKG